MKKNFSLYNLFTKNFFFLDNIYNSIKIILGPTGKNGIFYNSKKDIKILTDGSFLIKYLSSTIPSESFVLKIFKEVSKKTALLSGDGTSTTILISCSLLRDSIRYLIAGYDSFFISNGLKKIAFFLVEQVRFFSKPISNINQLIRLLKTQLGKKLNDNLIDLLINSLVKLGRDGLLLVEENFIQKNEIETIQGIELDKGYASSYFVNDLKTFEVIYEIPYILIAREEISDLNQIKDIIEYIKSKNSSLIIIAENIDKKIFSTLVLNTIQKKIKLAIIKYNSIKFLKNGILEDLSILSHCNFFESNIPLKNRIYSIKDLGQVEKVIIKKEKSIFIISKFSKLIAKRKINELNRELISSETEHEKILFKTRIARLAGNITKIKIAFSNKYQIEEDRQKIEKSILTIRSSLEEGILPGGGIFYFFLNQELKNWSYLNLFGDEIFSTQIVSNSLLKPIEELCNNNNKKAFLILSQINKFGYPYNYNLFNNKYSNSFENGILDSAKSIRAILWNSLTIIALLITSE